jgi:UDP:flavonoid glycosyltransferase YjiC (YdhE family)
MLTKPEMKTIVFAVAGYNLAETGRHIEIARACKDNFDILFLSYGGNFENLIEDEGFTLKRMKPRLTEKQLQHVRKALRGETLNTVGYFSAEEMAPRVANEIELFKEINPACVLTGWCQSIFISTRVVQVPFINVLHSTSVKEYYEAGLQSWPDRRNYFCLRKIFSEEKLNRFASNLVFKMKLPAKPFNILGKKYKLKEFKNFIEVLEGDYTLLADIPQWVGLKEIRPNLYFIGPLPYKSNEEVPKEILDMSNDKPVIYFAMGSSGKPKLIAEIIEGFKNKSYRVIAPVKSHINNMKVQIPDNVVVTGFVPAHKVNPLADISVIHGGQNTVMNACLSGTPIVGVGMHAEQQANLDACVRKGFAIRIRKREVSAKRILKAVDKLLNDDKAKEAVNKFKDELAEWNGPVNAAKFLYEKFGNNSHQ